MSIIYRAVAMIKAELPFNAGTINGYCFFEQSANGGVTRAYGTIKGLPDGLHGFHIHEFADFSNGCMSAGPHYNPFGKTHGGPDDEERHVGDLGNILANADGVSEGAITDRLIQLSGEYTVIGRSFMVHAAVDDLGKGGHELSSTTGNAGARIGCGVIRAV